MRCATWTSTCPRHVLSAGELEASGACAPVKLLWLAPAEEQELYQEQSQDRPKAAWPGVQNPIPCNVLCQAKVARILLW